jgi:murein DD-endopeptidase MepM/ murein hydrolase activator NlpD
MDEQLHIIIAGNKGKVFKLPCSRKKLCVAITASVVALLILTVATICSFSLYTRNISISNQLARLQQKLRNSADLLTRNNSVTEEQRLKIDLENARLELIEQANAFKEEKDSLISTAIDQLNERSELIGRIIGSIGIELPSSDNDDDAKHRGGLFIEHQDTAKDEVLVKADKYLNTIRYLPLGRPIKGSITSRFGKRKDPLNRRSAFHTGTDIRGKKGEPIYATADGVVTKSFRNGGYGNFVVIDHGNGYTTSFAHMQKYLVHKGDRVKRGQLIGKVGNTGRSTGSHLHYEITLNNKPINPYKFMKVDSLVQEVASLPEKK